MKTCPSCQKRSAVGGGYSNRVRAQKFNPTGKVRKYPNLQWITLPAGNRLKMCAKCIKAGKSLTFKA